jgi:hypothetical protein
MNQILYDWTPESMIEVTLDEPDNFLKVRETLTRIGIASKKENKLFQSCFILHKQSKYFIVHFKELFILDGRHSDISVEDIERRNTIAALLEDWGLVKIVDQSKVINQAPMTNIKIVQHREKDNWLFVAKYNIGNKKAA